jgi:hypothetical protein
MDKAYEKNMPVTTFLRDTFFPGVNTSPTEHLDVDSRKGIQSVAPFVMNNVGGVNVARIGYSTKTYTPPRVAPERPINKEILKTRIPGETIHTTMTDEQRQDYYLQQDAQELDDMITRREEVMVAQLMTKGVVNVRGYSDEKLTDYVDEDIDYSFGNLVTKTGAAQWSESGSKKYEDLESGCEKCFQGGFNPRHAIFGKSAWSALKGDTNFKASLDLLKLDLARVAPELRLQNGNGIKYLGYFNDLGLEFWVYYAWYKDEATGVLTPYIPDDFVVITPENIGEMLYGAITQLEKDERFHTYEGARVPKKIADQNNDTMKFRISSRPMPKPFDLDAWMSINTKGGAG